MAVRRFVVWLLLLRIMMMMMVVLNIVGELFVKFLLWFAEQIEVFRGHTLLVDVYEIVAVHNVAVVFGSSIVQKLELLLLSGRYYGGLLARLRVLRLDLFGFFQRGFGGRQSMVVCFEGRCPVLI